MAEKRVRELTPKVQSVLDLEVGESVFVTDNQTRVAQWFHTIQKRHAERNFKSQKMVAVDSVQCEAETITKIVRLEDDNIPSQ